MSTNPAASITKAASKQTYYTIRFLVDRDRVDDAYRAYGYFRWVDDVLDAAAHQVQAGYDTIAAIQHLHFDRDMAALSVRSPQHEPRAHRYVEQVIRLASGLLEAGAAYASGGSDFFRGRGVAGRVGLDQAEAAALSAEYGGRPGDPAKADPLDVAVWQAGEPGRRSVAPAGTWTRSPNPPGGSVEKCPCS